MKPQIKNILIICCLIGMGTSFMYHFSLNYNSLDEIKAPVHVNIEIDKAYAPFVSIMAGLQSGNRVFILLSEDNETRSVVLHSEIDVGNPVPPFIRRLFLHIPQETAQGVLNAIDGISIFIGNKMFYFPHSNVINFQGVEQNSYMIYELSGLEYKKSVIAAWLNKTSWINWYGDFNLAIKLVSVFLIHPEKYIITWCFLICFLILCWSSIENIYAAIQKQKTPMPELLLLGFIVLVGFILRFNGYVRYSSCGDELYSVSYASNPNLSFFNTFDDPGNPPFYYILLRLWFMLFDWTEQSGRLLSVLTGSAAIISLYFLVKRFANNKAAFLSAAYMAISAYLIGFSQETRCYTLEVFLVSIVAFRFLIVIQKQELSLKNLIWYIIPSVLLVNTHYYGSLFIFANFLFFVIHSIRVQTFTWRKTIVFFTGNIIISLSLLPYFIHTALREAMLNLDFNIWISKPGLTLICLAAFIPISGILYIYLRKTVFKKILTDSHSCFLDYSIFVMSVVYLIAFGISLYRSILIAKYLIILLPILTAFIAIIVTNVFMHSSRFISGLCICFALICIALGYEAEQGGCNDVYHESLAYISKDAEAHPQNISMEVLVRAGAASFYGYKELPLYIPGNNYDVLYFNPLHRSEEEMYSEMAKLGISAPKVLRIRVNNNKSVFKIYSNVPSE
ncbi:MAG: glycosyltransferase family 39 protein [Treponema sp.]|jgi:hypothetical protein|nr:glycosyltransferase family 39 protein [Treponema sp.]